MHKGIAIALFGLLLGGLVGGTLPMAEAEEESVADAIFLPGSEIKAPEWKCKLEDCTIGGVTTQVRECKFGHLNCETVWNGPCDPRCTDWS